MVRSDLLPTVFVGYFEFRSLLIRNGIVENPRSDCPTRWSLKKGKAWVHIGNACSLVFWYQCRRFNTALILV